MFYKDSMLVYAVFDSSSDYELIFTSNNLNEACEYLVGSILKSLKLCSSMEIPITNPNFSNFRIDVLKMGLNTRKTDTIYLDDFLLVSENNQLINHNGSILQELQEMKDLCKGKIKSRTKNNKNFKLVKNQSISIPKKTIHRIENIGKETLIIIEVQSGERAGRRSGVSARRGGAFAAEGAFRRLRRVRGVVVQSWN